MTGLVTIGGVALFLIGIHRIVAALHALAGAPARATVERATRSPWRALATGVVIGGASQSGSATSIIAVGVVDALEGLQRRRPSRRPPGSIARMRDPTPAPATDPGPVPPPLLTRLAALTAAFGRVGLFGFGGGPAFIPLIEREVEAHGWLSREAFLDAFAFGNALPGPIATKLAGYVGYRVAGWWGATAALVALTVPTILAMVALASLYVRTQESPWVAGFLSGLRPVVIALLVLTVVSFAPGALGPLRAWRGHLASWGIALAAFVAAVALDVHPGILILGGGLVGILLRRTP